MVKPMRLAVVKLLNPPASLPVLTIALLGAFLIARNTVFSGDLEALVLFSKLTNVLLKCGAALPTPTLGTLLVR